VGELPVNPGVRRKGLLECKEKQPPVRKDWKRISPALIGRGERPRNDHSSLCRRRRGGPTTPGRGEKESISAYGNRWTEGPVI